MVDINLIYPVQLEKSAALYPPLGIGYIDAILKGHLIYDIIKNFTIIKESLVL